MKTQSFKRLAQNNSEDARKYASAAVFAHQCACGVPAETARTQAEDAAQEGLLRVLRGKSKKYKSGKHFVHTVARAAINWAISEYGRKKGAAPLGEHDPCDPGSLDDGTDDNTPALDLLRAATAKLPAPDRELLRLKYEENLTLEDIADKTGSTLNRVWYRLEKIRQKLKREIEAKM